MMVGNQVVVNHTGCWRNTWYLEMDMNHAKQVLHPSCLEESKWITCNMKRGDVLFFSNLLPHRSLSNLSSTIRWSLDLRWQLMNQPNGFDSIKPCILMRDFDKFNEKQETNIEWKEWTEINRNKLQQQIKTTKKENSNINSTIVIEETTSCSEGKEFKKNEQESEVHEIGKLVEEEGNEEKRTKMESGLTSNKEMRNDSFYQKDESDNEMLPIISGPWMNRWPITNHNVHTEYWNEAQGNGM